MLLFSIPVNESSHWSLQQATTLLKEKGLEMSSPGNFSDSLKDVVRENHAAFGLSPSEANFMTETLESLDTLPGAKPVSAPKVTTLLEARVASRARNWTAAPRPSCPVGGHLFELVRLADLADVQLKVVTVFDGHLSARKIGRRGARKVTILANPDRQYTVLAKTSSNDSTHSNGSAAEMFAVTATTAVGSQGSLSTGSSLNVSAERHGPTQGWARPELKRLDNKRGTDTRLRGPQEIAAARTRDASAGTQNQSGLAGSGARYCVGVAAEELL